MGSLIYTGLKFLPRQEQAIRKLQSRRRHSVICYQRPSGSRLFYLRRVECFLFTSEKHLQEKYIEILVYERVYIRVPCACVLSSFRFISQFPHSSLASPF